MLYYVGKRKLCYAIRKCVFVEFRKGLGMYKSKKMGLFLIASLLIASFVIGGQAFARPAAQNSIVLRVGYIGEADSDMVRGMMLAIDEINDAGGVIGPNNIAYEFEVVVASVTDTSGVATALQSLANQQVISIFGPDTNELVIPNITALSQAAVPILSATTDDAVLSQDTNGNVFRLVAPDSVYNSALASYLVTDLALQSIVIVQTDAALNTGALNFSDALNNLSVPPSQLIQVADSSQLPSSIVTLPESNPNAIVMFGGAEDIMTALNQLRSNSWSGIFAFRTNDDMDTNNALLDGALSVDNWTFGVTDNIGSVFTVNYVSQFGAVPSALSASGYDGIYALSSVVSDGGPAPALIRTLLNEYTAARLVRGPMNPALYGNRTLSRTAYIYELTGQGGVEALAAYDNNVKRTNFVVNEPPPVAAVASPTATLIPQATSTFTPVPTATPSVVTGTVNVGALRVRSGPSTAYPQVDELNRGDQVVVAGRNDDFTWLFIQYQGRVGWISAQFVDIFDPGGLLGTVPFIPPPATPTPGPTDAPPDADLVITDVVFSPAQPVVNTPLTATVTIQNQGSTAAGPFAVATSFKPGDIFNAQNLTGLAAGQTITTTLSATITQTGYVPDLAFVVDLNEEVFEGGAGSPGESNNLFIKAYRVDKPVLTEAQTTLTPGLSINFFGPNLDMSWDGSTFTMAGGLARIGVMASGQTYDIVHYGQVAGSAVNNAISVSPPGTVFAIITQEGDYGFIRIDSTGGGNVTFTYRIYQH